MATYKNKLLYSNLTVSEKNELLISGHSAVGLAEKYKTPVYLLDEQRIRERCRQYVGAMKNAFGDKGGVLYASKALSFKRIYEIVGSEGRGCDVVSCGEIATAVASGFDMSNAYFHSNNKTDEDIAFAMNNGVGHFVTDNAEELYAIQKEAKKRGISQKILLRLTPGIDPHTFEAVSTGKVDSKFGSAIETGQAKVITREAINLSNIVLDGFHCHIGSQVFDASLYLRACDVMLNFVKEVKKEFGFDTEILDLGGGFGVRYTSRQQNFDIVDGVEKIADFMYNKVNLLGLKMPKVLLEPGRSIVADSGCTLYTVGTLKNIPGYRKYVSVDGGMTDHIRYAMYKAPYTLLPCVDPLMKNCETMTVDVVGRCCESGDILQRDVTLPANIIRGDIIACLTTGAYHYSMASNYNRIPRPPVVMINGDETYLAVKRETNADLLRLDR